MPKKDPITGCMVMTTDEFWAHEAKREGKGRCGGDLLMEYLEDLDKEEAEYEKRMRQKENAEKFISGLWEDFESCEPGVVEKPLEIGRVLEVVTKNRYSDSYLKITALARKVDGTIGKICAWESSTSGSFYEPPDGEMDIYWVEKDGTDG